MCIKARVQYFFSGKISIIMAENSQIIFILLVLQYFGNFIIVETVQETGKFMCLSSGRSINFVELCDGIADCEDESDENACENEAVLLYFTNETKVPRRTDDFVPYFCTPDDTTWDHEKKRCVDYDGSKRFNLTGIYLKNRKEFSITLLRKSVWDQSDHAGRYWRSIPSWRNVRLVSNGRQVAMTYTQETSGVVPGTFKRKDVDEQRLKRISRDGSIQLSEIEDDIQSLTVDWVTSNIYFISNSSIKACDKDFIICQNLTSKFINDPVHLMIAPKNKSLFWIERKSSNQFSLFKYQLDRSSVTTVIQSDLKSPRWLTHDPVSNRVYWLDGNDNKTFFYSTAIDGKDRNVTRPGIPISSSTTSFAVFNNTLYWPDNEKKRILKCSAYNCTTTATAFKNFTTSQNLTIDQLIIDYRVWPPSKIPHACNNSSCSHLCLPRSESAFDCYCEDSIKPLPTNASSGFCNDRTLIATYKNQLHVIALTRDWRLPPKTRKYTLNISSIATVTYNSVEGTVILTEVGVQNIYSWTPKSGQLKLIFKNGTGTITSVEYDDRANNLYWINPTNFAMNVMNLRTHRYGTILERNSTYFPFEFTLAPAKGYMFVLFFKNNASVIMERISMDGAQTTRKILYRDPEAHVGNISLHYMRQYQLLCLLDKQRNEIRYFTGNKEFRDMTTSVGGKIENIVSIQHYIIWSKDDLLIHRGWVELEKLTSNQTILQGFQIGTQILSEKIGKTYEMLPVQEISLNLKKLNNSVLKITAIVKSADEQSNKQSKCLKNAACKKGLCISAEKGQGFSCLCYETPQLSGGTSCDREGLGKSESSSIHTMKKELNGIVILVVFILYVLTEFASFDEMTFRRCSSRRRNSKNFQKTNFVSQLGEFKRRK